MVIHNSQSGSGSVTIQTQNRAIYNLSANQGLLPGWCEPRQINTKLTIAARQNPLKPSRSRFSSLSSFGFFPELMLCRSRQWLLTRSCTVLSSHSGHLHFASGEKIQRQMTRIYHLAHLRLAQPSLEPRAACVEGEDHHQPIPYMVFFISDGVRLALEKDHVAEDEYVEVNMPPLLEHTSELIVNGSFSPPESGHVFFLF